MDTIASAPIVVYLALQEGPRSTHQLRALGLSEPAVWQAVHRLRLAGHDVRYLRGRYELRSKLPLSVRHHAARIVLGPM